MIYRQVKSATASIYYERQVAKLVFVMRDNQNRLHFCYKAYFFIRCLYTRFTLTYTVHEVGMELRHIVKFFCQISDFFLTLRNTLIKSNFHLLTLKF